MMTHRTDTLRTSRRAHSLRPSRDLRAYLPTSSSASSNFNDTEHAVLHALALLINDGLSATLEELVRTPARLSRRSVYAS
jgi:hypothetical protein